MIVAATQALVAWLMSMLTIVYAPIPMLSAAVIGGLVFKGSPKQASLTGALAGLTGGVFTE